MPLEKRIVTEKDREILYRRPVEQLSNFELLSVLEAGTRLGPTLTETLNRLRSGGVFIEEMFDFGDSQTSAIANKFKNWFSSHLADTTYTEASIISEIAKSYKYGDRAKEFMPANLRFYFGGFSDKKKFKVIDSWLRCLEGPEKFFQSAQGMITPVILAIKHLGNHDNLSEVSNSIDFFFRRYEQSGSSENNRFITGSLRASLTGLTDVFIKTRPRNLSEIAEFASILSRFDNKGYQSKVPEETTDIQKLFSSRLLSDDYIKSVIDGQLKCVPKTRESLLGEINSERSFRIISDFFDRGELMAAGRSIRGYLLADELGL